MIDWQRAAAMRLVLALVGLCALVFIIVAPWKSDINAAYTELTAKEKAEKIFCPFLADARLTRTDFGSPVVELTNGDALVSFKSMSTPGESVVITLGKDGSQGISPLLPSLDFPQCPGCP
jgi:hypothetical protein